MVYDAKSLYFSSMAVSYSINPFNEATFVHTKKMKVAFGNLFVGKLSVKQKPRV